MSHQAITQDPNELRESQEERTICQSLVKGFYWSFLHHTIVTSEENLPRLSHWIRLPSTLQRIGDDDVGLPN
jgi:hypothetical protein